MFFRPGRHAANLDRREASGCDRDLRHLPVRREVLRRRAIDGHAGIRHEASAVETARQDR